MLTARKMKIVLPAGLMISPVNAAKVMKKSQAAENLMFMKLTGPVRVVYLTIVRNYVG